MADNNDIQGKAADQAGAFKQTDAKLGDEQKATGKSGSLDAQVNPDAANTDDLKK